MTMSLGAVRMTACVACKKRKVKCDNGKPRCSNCVMYDTECKAGVDRRKRASPHDVVNSPARGNPKRLMSNQEPSHVAERHSQDSNFTAGHRLQFWVDLVDGPGFVNNSSPPMTIPTPRADSDHDAVVVESHDSTQQKDTPFAQPGKLQVAEDGVLRYFGPTSSLHLLHNGPFSSFRPQFQTLHVHGQAALERAELTWTPDQPYIDTLFEVYCKWDNKLINLVNLPIFRHEKVKFENGQHCQYYSPTLENAILATGARHVNSAHSAIPENPMEFFASRAHTLLQVELDVPTIATIQALLVLSILEAGRGHDSKGWMYCGMAIRILSDLGLDHHGLEQSASRHENDAFSALNANVIRATFCTEVLWSSWCGRMPAMKLPAELRVQMDKVISEQTLEPTLTFTSTCSSDEAETVHVHLLRLMVLHHEIITTLYSSAAISQHSLTASVARIQGDLAKWKHSFNPSPISFDSLESSTCPQPQTIELCLQYHYVTILLHRPSLEGFETGTVATPPLASSSAASKACLSSATEVCGLLRTFSQKYGIKNLSAYSIQPLVTAALAFCYASTSTTNASEVHDNDLKMCMDMLSELSVTYKVALRALDVVTSLRREWALLGSKLRSRH